jgi:4-amino-4-deoxy-L-arabinose transferase-like glycosyltransferase
VSHGSRGFLLAALLLGAAVRLGAWLQIQDGPLLHLHRWTVSDMNFYDRWAKDIAAGDWLTDTRMRPYHPGHASVARQAYLLSGAREPFDDARGERIWDSWLGAKSFYQDPLYAYFLALLYRLFGPSVGVAVLAQSLLGLGCVGLLFAIAQRLFGPTVADVAALVAALYGPLLLYETVLLKPVLIAATSLLSLLLLLRAFDVPSSRWRWAAAGAAGGLTFLAQSSGLLFFLPAVALVAWHLRSDGKKARAAGACLLAAFAMMIAPVVVRNVVVGAPPFVFSATGGWTFLNHNAEDYEPAIGDAVTRHAGEIMRRTGGDLLATAVATIATHDSPLGWLRVLWGKLACFWHWYEMPNNTNYYLYQQLAPALAAFAIPYSLVAPLALFGLVTSARRDPGWLLLALLVGSGVTTLVVFYNISRLRLPTAVALIPFAAFGLVTLSRWLGAQHLRRAAGGAVFVAVAAAIMLRPLSPGVSKVRPGDYGVLNEIVLNLARLRVQDGHGVEALRLLERQLALEPPDLRQADPRSGETRISRLSASLAGQFGPLHLAAAERLRSLGRAAEAAEHERRAAILETIAARFRAEAGGATP